MDLSKLCNVVKYDVVKKPAYDDKTKVNASKTIDTSDLVKKADCNTKIVKKILNHNNILPKNMKS